MNQIETADSPKVEFIKDEKTLIISGNSYPEDCAKIYEPIINFIEEYNGDKLKLSCHFNLIGSASAVYMSKIAAKLSELEGIGIMVDWKYDVFDEELCELGERLELIHKVPFSFMPIEGEE